MPTEKKADKPTAREQIKADLETYVSQRRMHMETAYQARQELEAAEKRIQSCSIMIAGLQLALSKNG